jgi:hypothetical protein
MLAWSVFGGLARNLAPCDPDLSLATNVRQAILSEGAPLMLEGSERLRRAFQSPGRYGSLLSALSTGPRVWSEVLLAAPDFDTGGQIAPYLSRLQSLRLTEAEASLDAAPNSRSRRYRIVDPFLAFWYRFVLPNLTDLMDGRGREVWRDAIRGPLDDHAAKHFPIACREYLAHHAERRFQGTAREVGGLWGEGYDIEVAGTLRTGAAVYGRALWARGPAREAVDLALLQEVGHTRYGYGREARLRVIFSSDGFARSLLRRGAIGEDIHLMDLADLYEA